MDTKVNDIIGYKDYKKSSLSWGIVRSIHKVLFSTDEDDVGTTYCKVEVLNSEPYTNNCVEVRCEYIVLVYRDIEKEEE